MKRHGAIAILKFMKEKGVLMALKNEPNGSLCRRGTRRVLRGDEPEADRGDRLPEVATPANGNAASGMP